MTSSLQGFRASSQQRRLWSLRRPDDRPGDPYGVHCALALDGALDRAALAAALAGCERRNEVLRTGLVCPDGLALPIQVIADAGGERGEDRPLPLVDLSGLPAMARAGEVNRRAAAGAPLGAGGRAWPLGWLLLRLAAGDGGGPRHLLLVSLAGGLADAGSAGDLLRQLAEEYAAARRRRDAGPASAAGSETAAADPPLQYADYAEWQHQLGAAEESAPGIAHWQGCDLAQVGEPRLAFEREPGAEAPFRPRSWPEPVPSELAAAAAELARRLETSAANVWLGAWTALLGRLLDADGLTLGVLRDGREVEALRDTQGLFARYLPVTAPAGGGLAYIELLRRLAAQLAEAEVWQELFAWEGPQHFPFCFEWQENPPPRQAAGLTWSLARLRAVIDRFRLRLTCSSGPSLLAVELVYDASLFGAEDAARLTASLFALVAAAAAAPELQLAELQAVGPRERRLLLREWNGTAAAGGGGNAAASSLARRTPWAPEETVPGLIARQAALDGQRLAVIGREAGVAGGEVAVDGGEGEPLELSYGDLLVRAARLARRLRVLGAGPERVVGVLLERSPSAVAAILGVLEAGAAYLPLDPVYPPERLAYMVADSGAVAVVSRRSLQGTLRTVTELAQEAGRELPALLIEDVEADELAPAAAGGAAGAAETRAAVASLDQLAYVIYTSGSTGRPKGVGVTHRNLAHSTRARFAYYPRQPEAFLLMSSLSFDSSVAGLFWSLCAGATLVLAEERFQLDLTLLAQNVRRRRVSHLLCLPSLYSLLIEQPEMAAAADLRAVIVAGEGCPAPLVRRHFERLPGVGLYNEYGPTEATVWSSVHDCARWAGSGRVPIGGPIPGSRLHVLSAAGVLAPLGAPAELCVGGAGVTRGYLGRPAATAARFVPDPFGAAGGRLYRTGDRVSWRADGELEFLGRGDDQVKIRGHRVEPEEIAAALLAHSGVREAAVVAPEGKTGERRLVAFVVAADGGAAPAAEELRRCLAGRLPEPMVPSRFVAIERLPLTPNGKVDRRALERLQLPRSAAGAGSVAPATAAEQALAAVWSEVLGVERVGALDDFFQLGGDSILSLQVRARAEEHGLHFTVQEIFEHRTVRALAARAAGREPSFVARAVQPPAAFELLGAADRQRLPADADDAYPMASLQWGMLYHEELDGRGVFHDITSFHLRLAWDEQALRRALRRLAAAHPILRTSLHLSASREPLQVVHREVEIPLAVTDVSGQTPTEQERTLRSWMEAERHRRFTWTRAPLLRLQVHRRGERSLQFTVSEHHAILDGWSMASLLTELLQSYVHLMAGEEAPAAPGAPATGMRDFVILERQALDAAGAREFWQTWLQGAPSGRLPGWVRPSPMAATAPGDELRQQLIVVPAAVVERLRQLADEARVPFRSVLLAAHLRLVAALAGSATVVTGCVTHGRPEAAGGDRALGLFLNTVPLRLRLRDGDWHDLVAQVFAAERELMPHRRFPMAEMRRWRQEPLFETAFNFVDFHVYQAVDALPGVELLGVRTWEDTDLPLFANFLPADGGAGLRLLLNTHASLVGERQAEAIGALYRQLLEVMAAEPRAPHAEIEAVAAACMPGGGLEPFAAAHGDERRVAGPPANGEPVPPCGPVEKALAAIWEEVLGLEQVGADDDFGVLGGRSLAALQVLVRVRERLGVPIGLRELLLAPTVRRQAAAVAACSGAEEAAALASWPMAVTAAAHLEKGD